MHVINCNIIFLYSYTSKKDFLIIMINTETIQQDRENARPFILKALCISTFISSGLSALFFLGCILLSGKVSEFINEYALNYNSLPLYIYIITSAFLFLLFVFSTAGAFMIFNNHSNGFYFYVIPNSIIMVMNIILVYITLSPFWMIYFLISLLSVILYAFFSPQKV
jgi:hypothetical protein